MSCLLTQGFNLDCRDQGGVKKIYLASAKAVESMTEEAGEITAISMETNGAFYEYELIAETAGWSEDITVSEENNTHMYEQEISFFIPKKNAQKRNEILLMAKANVVAIVVENDGATFLLGRERGLTLGGSAQSGTSYEDRSGYELTLTGTQTEPAPEVDPDIIEALLTPAV